MNKYYFRRFRNKVSVNSKRRFSLNFLLKILFIFIISLTLLVLIIYIGVYSGYQTKLIQNINNIPEEYKEATIILDEYPENDSLYFGFLDRAYDARKFTHAKVYTLADRKEEDLKPSIKKFPLNRVDFDLENKDLSEICKNISESFQDQKTVIIANPDIAVRSANICNNINVLSIPATIEDTDYLVYTTSFRIRLEELFKILINQLENK